MRSYLMLPTIVGHRAIIPRKLSDGHFFLGRLSVQSEKGSTALARLVIKSEGLEGQVILLKLGINRVGRHPSNDFQIEHPTISSSHCELSCEDGVILVKDCDSTNGTFVDGERICEARLSAGQTFCIGEVELLVETTEVSISVPKIEVVIPAPPVVKSDGSLECPRHPEALVTHQCTKCREVMCQACVHKLRRRGGKLLELCPICGSRCEPIKGTKKKKRSLLGFFAKTAKMPLLRGGKGAEDA